MSESYKTYVVTVQRECGKRANPINHVAKVVCSARSIEDAERVAMHATLSAVGVRQVLEVAPGSAQVVSY